MHTLWTPELDILNSIPKYEYLILNEQIKCSEWKTGNTDISVKYWNISLNTDSCCLTLFWECFIKYGSVFFCSHHVAQLSHFCQISPPHVMLLNIFFLEGANAYTWCLWNWSLGTLREQLEIYTSPSNKWTSWFDWFGQSSQAVLAAKALCKRN